MVVLAWLPAAFQVDDGRAHADQRAAALVGEQRARLAGEVIDTDASTSSSDNKSRISMSFRAMPPLMVPFSNISSRSCSQFTAGMTLPCGFRMPPVGVRKITFVIGARWPSPARRCRRSR